jgi:uncharacterized membrane protein YdjX (TVP38/TMEM64 family)
MTYRPSRTAVVSVLLAFGLPVTAWLLSADLRDAVGRAIAILTTADIDAAIAALIDYLRSFGIWAPVVSAALMVLQSVAAPIPAFLLTFANGMLFGWFWGAALSWLSAMAGAALCFWLARVLGRPAVERLAGGGAVLSTTDRFFERFGTHSILVARLLPFVSFDVVSYAAGLTPMRFLRFLIATGIGQLPATLLYSWLGQSVSGGLRAVFWAFSIAAALAVLSVAIAPLLRRRFGAEAGQ